MRTGVFFDEGSRLKIDYIRKLWFLETNYIGWWGGLWPILIKPNWKFKVLINGCDTCFDDTLDKMKELQELQKIMIYDLLPVNSACACIQVQQEKGTFQRLEIYRNMAPLNYDSKKGSVLFHKERIGKFADVWGILVGYLLQLPQSSKCACSAKRSWFGSEYTQLENTPAPSRCNWFPLRCTYTWISS